MGMLGNYFKNTAFFCLGRYTNNIKLRRSRLGYFGIKWLRLIPQSQLWLTRPHHFLLEITNPWSRRYF